MIRKPSVNPEGRAVRSGKRELFRQRSRRAQRNAKVGDQSSVTSYQSAVIGGGRDLVGGHFQSGGVAGGAGANGRIRSRWSCKASKFWD